MGAKALKPRKTPRQRRSAAMVETILEAAARVIDRGTLARFNTNRVAEVAGISVGSLYQYFPNKDALVAALIERAQLGLDARLAAALEGARGKALLDGLRLLVRAGVAAQTERPALAAALDFEEARLPVQGLLAGSAARLRGRVLTFLEWHRRRLRIDDLARAAADIQTIARALVDEAAREGPIDARALEDRVVRATAGYLLPPRGAGG